MEIVAPHKVGLSSARLTRLDGVMQRFVDEGQLPNVLAFVARHGQVAYCKCFGERDVAAHLPVQEDTIFRIYSMSKPITSAAVLMLYEEGHFLLSDPISGFIPELQNLRVFASSRLGETETVPAEREITIMHLLPHPAGLAYGLELNEPADVLYEQQGLLRRDESAEAKIKRLATMPLARQPGTAWKYSVAVDVLGRLVEVVASKPFGQFLRERIFEPLGMVDTGFSVSAAQQQRFSVLYGATDAGLEAWDPIAGEYATVPAFESGGGGLVSTAGDYWRFAQMLLNGGQLDGIRLLGPKTVALMTSNVLPPALTPFAADQAGYGFGLGVKVLLDAAQSGMPGTAGEYGWSGAAATHYWGDPREGLVGLFMTQVIGARGPYHPLFKLLTYQALVD
jgi:CubicO group peptidase (beta-lactamase class C family)